MQGGFLVRLELFPAVMPGALQFSARALQQLAGNRKLRSILGVLSKCQLDAASLQGDITAQRIAFTQLGIEPIERMVIQCGLRRLRSFGRENWWLALIAWPAVACAWDPRHRQGWLTRASERDRSSSGMTTSFVVLLSLIHISEP